jgi:hypothetical protein
MRWLVIIWLLLSGAADIYTASKAISYSHQTLSLFDQVRDSFSGGHYSGDAYDQLSSAIARLRAMLFSTSVKLSYCITWSVALLAIFSSLLLIVKRHLGVQVSLVTLAVMLVWGTYTAFARESYRQSIRSAEETIYQSVSVLSGTEVTFSPQLEQAFRSDLAGSLSWLVPDVILLVGLLLKRNVPAGEKGIQPTECDRL